MQAESVQLKIDIYKYADDAPSHTQSYLLPTVMQTLGRYGGEKRLFEIGYGNAATARHLVGQGFSVTGVEPSADGQRIAAESGIELHGGSTDEDLAARFGHFPIVLSLEVIEHVYSPKLFAQRTYDLLEPGGIAIVSTPYHGYLKNLALAVTGKMDNHFTALWEGGHIKFFSRATMAQLFENAGMREIEFHRVGRIGVLAKSMIGVYRKSA